MSFLLFCSLLLLNCEINVIKVLFFANHDSKKYKTSKNKHEFYKNTNKIIYFYLHWLKISKLRLAFIPKLFFLSQFIFFSQKFRKFLNVDWLLFRSYFFISIYLLFATSIDFRLAFLKEFAKIEKLQLTGVSTNELIRLRCVCRLILRKARLAK